MLSRFSLSRDAPCSTHRWFLMLAKGRFQAQLGSGNLKGHWWQFLSWTVMLAIMTMSQPTEMYIQCNWNCSCSPIFGFLFQRNLIYRADISSVVLCTSHTCCYHSYTLLSAVENTPCIQDIPVPSAAPLSGWPCYINFQSTLVCPKLWLH
jgi:hypothetical protein